MCSPYEFLRIVDLVNPNTANYTHCGACHQYFHPSEALYALTSTSHPLIDGIQYWPISETATLDFCDTDCTYGHGPLRVPVVHRYCLDVFLKTCAVPDRLFRLWVATMAKLPWVLVKPVALPAQPTDPTLLHGTMRALGIPHFQRLPLEIQCMILARTESHAVWRVWAVLEQAARLARQPPQQRETCAWLCNIKLWERGMPYALLHYPHAQTRRGGGFVRLTLDACGISKIEFVAQADDPSSADHRHQLFVFQSLESVARVGAGHCRCSIPYGTDFVLWNNPDPVELFYAVSSFYPGIDERIYCLNTGSAFGLTFFLVGGLVRAIHAHTESHPTALRTFQTLGCPDRGRAIWTYVPLPPGEKIMGLGLRKLRGCTARQIGHFNFLIALKSRGVICIGRPIVGRVRDMLLLADGRPMIMYNLGRRSSSAAMSPDAPPRYLEEGIDTIGTYPAFKPDYYTHTVPYRNVPTLYSDLFDSFSSSAPLEGIAAVDIFLLSPSSHPQPKSKALRPRPRSPLPPFCAGLLFTYQDGQQRAIGQCRLGIDRVYRVDKPQAICHTDIWPRRRGQQPGYGHGSIIRFLTSVSPLGPQEECQLSEGKCYHHPLVGYAMMCFYLRATQFMIGWLQSE